MNDPITGLPTISMDEIRRRFNCDVRAVHTFLEHHCLEPYIRTPGGDSVRWDEFARCLEQDDTAAPQAVVPASATDEATIFSYWNGDSDAEVPTEANIKVFRQKIVAWQIYGENAESPKLTRTIAVLGTHHLYNGEGTIEKAYLESSDGLFAELPTLEDKDSATWGNQPQTRSEVIADVLKRAVGAWWQHSGAPIAVAKRAEWKIKDDEQRAKNQAVIAERKARRF